MIPVPRVTVAETVTWVRDVAQAQTCAPTRRLLHPVYKRARKGLCEQFHRRLQGIREARGKRYGTGMVIDYTTVTGARRAAVMVLDGTLAFRLVLIVDISARTVGTRAPKGFGLAARRAVEALAHADCDAFLRVASRALGVGREGRAQVCERLPTLGVSQKLLKHPSVKPERLGGNRAFAFYGLRFAPGDFYTLLMVRQPPRQGAADARPRYAFVTAVPAK